jgi:hypothetical protein
MLPHRPAGHRSSGSKRPRHSPEPPLAAATKHARREPLPPQLPPPPAFQRVQSIPRGFPCVSPGPTADRGSPEYADFWDPVWRYEHGVVRFLRKQGQVPMGELYERFPLPAIYPQPSWGECVPPPLARPPGGGSLPHVSLADVVFCTVQQRVVCTAGNWQACKYVGHGAAWFKWLACFGCS